MLLNGLNSLYGSQYPVLGMQGQNQGGFNMLNGGDTSGSGFGFNLDTAKFGMGLLGQLGGLYGANQMNRLAREQFNFMKGVTNTNLNNQIQSYNTAMEDRARSRMVMEGRPQSDADAYMERNRLTR